MRVVQIFTDGYEGLYQFNDVISDEQIKGYWDEYVRSEYDNFEEFMNETYPDIHCERFFVDSEIYI